MEFYLPSFHHHISSNHLHLNPTRAPNHFISTTNMINPSDHNLNYPFDQIYPSHQAHSSYQTYSSHQTYPSHPPNQSYPSTQTYPPKTYPSHPSNQNHLYNQTYQANQTYPSYPFNQIRPSHSSDQTHQFKQTHPSYQTAHTSNHNLTNLSVNPPATHHRNASLNSPSNKALSVKEQFKLQVRSAMNTSDPDPVAKVTQPVSQSRKLRKQARRHHFLAEDCDLKAYKAQQRGLLEQQQQFSKQSARHQQLMRDANQAAAAVVFQENNQGLDADQLDLHGLQTEEAMGFLQDYMANAVCKFPSVSIITGRGLHSTGGVPKIKPAVISYLQEQCFVFTEANPGMLLVHLR